MSEHFSNKELKNAAKMVRDSMLASLPEPWECQYSYSEMFLQKMRDLIRKAAKKASRQRVLKRVAAVFIATVVGVTSWLTVDTRAREVVFGWVRSVCEHFVEYTYAGSEKEIRMPEYELSWVPNGFELLELTVFEDFYSAFYLDAETGDTIVFEYLPSVNSTMIQLLDSEEEIKHDIVNVNGIEADFYHAGSLNTNNLIWIDTATNIFFKIDSNLDQAVILHIAEGVQLVEDS